MLSPALVIVNPGKDWPLPINLSLIYHLYSEMLLLSATRLMAAGVIVNGTQPLVATGLKTALASGFTVIFTALLMEECRPEQSMVDAILRYQGTGAGTSACSNCVYQSVGAGDRRSERSGWSNKSAAAPASAGWQARKLNRSGALANHCVLSRIGNRGVNYDNNNAISCAAVA